MDKIASVFYRRLGCADGCRVSRESGYGTADKEQRTRNGEQGMADKGQRARDSGQGNPPLQCGYNLAIFMIL